MHIALVEDYLKELMDPECAQSIVLPELLSTLEARGCARRVVLDVHWWPDSEALALQLILDLRDHSGVVHEWWAHR